MNFIFFPCRRQTFRILLYVAAIFSLSIFSFSYSLVAIAAEKPKQILFLPSYNYAYPAIQLFDKGLREGLAEQNDLKFNILLENIPFADYPNDDDYYLHMAEALKIKYERNKPDLIIAQYKQSTQFLLKYGHLVFGSEIPVIFAGIESEDYRNVKLPSNYTGITSTYNIKKNIDLILQLHPKIKTIYVVAGMSSNVVNDAIKETKNYKDKVIVEIMNRLPYEQMLDEIERIQGDAAIIYTAMQVDVSGKTFVPAVVAKELAVRAKVPVYGMLDTYANSGIMGGFLISNNNLGKRSATICGNILRGGMSLMG